MKNIRFKYVFLLLFTFLFTNLLSINVSEIKAEEQIDLTNAYRGEIMDYWALVNYGENFVGEDQVTIFLDPLAIANKDISYIQINEFNEYGEIITTYFKRGVDSSFASRFTYKFVDSYYGEKSLTIFLLEDLLNKPTSIIDRIDITDLEKIRTIKNLDSADFVLSQEVEEMTYSPYKVYFDIRENACDYKIKEVTYSYDRKDEDGSILETITGSAIMDDSIDAPCNRFYFTVSENATYYVTVEDHFGYIKPDADDELSIVIDNLHDDVINIVASYDNRLTRYDVSVNLKVYNGRGEEYNHNELDVFEYSYGGRVPQSLINVGSFNATENGIYTIHVKAGEKETTTYVNITNIDREKPVVSVEELIEINSSDVEKMPYVFDPKGYVLAIDNATLGDKLQITYEAHNVVSSDPTCKVDFDSAILGYDVFNYLYGVNDVCILYTVTDEAGNERQIATKVTVRDNTIPTITSSKAEIILQIGDEPLSEEELEIKFGLNYSDNSKLYDFNNERTIIITSDWSSVNFEELNRYPISIIAIDESGNESEELILTVIITERILVIDAVPNQYIVYGEPMIEILYTCNGNPCINHEDAEILPADWSKLSGELYISNGATYADEYTIHSNLAINSKKYTIQLGTLGKFYIKQRTFKIIADSFAIDYKDDEPILTWHMDTSVCNPDLSTKYTSLNEINYSCTFVSNDSFGGGSYPYEVKDGIQYYAGGIQIDREGHIGYDLPVKYDLIKNVDYYKIVLGNLDVDEVSSGGKDNYYLDFYGLYNDILWQEPNGEGYARFYVYPKHVEVTLYNATKIYGESDPSTIYVDENASAKKEDGVGNVQYEFSCNSFGKKPIATMTTSQCQQEIMMGINRQEGENVGKYKIEGLYTNENYLVMFNEEHESGAIPAVYLDIIKRDIQLSVDGVDGTGKYTIIYEDALPVVTISVTTDPTIPYKGLANNNYSNINDGSIITFVDRLDYGEHPVKYVNSDGQVVKVTIGGYSEYIDGVGTFKITRDTTTILNYLDQDVFNNYNVDFIDGTLEVVPRLIYIKVVDGLKKIYGEQDPLFSQSYIQNTYPDKDNYIVDGNMHFVLQIINTLENNTEIDDDSYEPFDKDKLEYYLVRSNIRRGYNSVDIQDGVHDGEVVGDYLVSCSHFENDSNYIIRIYQDYYFTIDQRIAYININDAIIEFNYQNIIPKFSYSFSNLAFFDKPYADTLIGQPKVAGYNGAFRNNGDYRVSMGDITVISAKPDISSVDTTWFINDQNTGVTFDEIEHLDCSLITIKNGRYHIIDVLNSQTINTNIAAKETDLMWNYSFEVDEGILTVIARKVIIIPEDGYGKTYGDVDGEKPFNIYHVVDGEWYPEVLVDPSDFVGSLDREEGEAPGVYEILIGTLAPAQKGEGYNFEIVDPIIERNHFYTIERRELTLRYTPLKEGETILIAYYGDTEVSEIKGYTTQSGSLAVQESHIQNKLCTIEVINNMEMCHEINDTIAGELYTDPEFTGDVGTYVLKSDKLKIVRIENPEIDVTEYYDFTFVEATVVINPREITVTPLSNQYKTYGDIGKLDERGCEVSFSHSPSLLYGDSFVGCLTRYPITNILGEETIEDVYSPGYDIVRGDLSIDNPNYKITLIENRKYHIHPRNLVITTKVEGDTVIKISNSKYSMVYGGKFTISYDIEGDGLARNPTLNIFDEMTGDIILSPEYKGVGIYTIVDTQLSVTNRRNYIWDFKSSEFEVEKKTIYIVPEYTSKIYGKEDPIIPYQVVGANVVCVGKVGRVAGEDVNIYAYNLGDLDCGNDYNMEITDTNHFEIIARKIYVNAYSYEIIHSYEDPEFDYDFIVEEENFENITKQDLGRLTREPGSEVGVYQIIREENFAWNLINYEIVYTPGTLTIYYAEFTSIEIVNVYNNQYQTQDEEELVKVFARFNKGANPNRLDEVQWKIVKNGTNNIIFDKDANNIVSFTPSGSLGTYVITATLDGITATHEIIVSVNNVVSIHIFLERGEVIQKLGATTPIIYGATVKLVDQNKDDEVYLDWYAGENLVCRALLKNTGNYCEFTPDLPIGTHKVYAQIGKAKSEEYEITIIDNEIPQIILEEPDVITYIEAHQNKTENSKFFKDPGFRAIDDIDGDITHLVKVKGIEKIDYYTVETYYIIYEVSDSHGHVANNFRMVVVEDTIAPTITINQVGKYRDVVYLEYGEPYIEYGAEAYDAYDAYHNKPLEIQIISNINLNKIGVYQVVYSTFDSNRMRGQAVRTVEIRDNVKPEIELIGDESMTIQYKDKFIDPGAWFIDNYDPKQMIYASQIQFKPKGYNEYIEVSSVDTSLLGEYRLTYYREDSSNNPPVATKYRVVNVVDTTPPVITLLGSNPYILRYGTKYEEPGYRVIDNYDGDITNREDLVTVVEVIGDTLGTYYVYYKAIDTNKNPTVEIKREVIIMDLVSPIIKFTERCPQFMTIEAFTDLDPACYAPGTGYTVYDDYTPDLDAIQNWVEITGEIDNTTVGTYYINYNVSDRSGNASVTMVREVSVVDKTPPKIILKPNEDNKIDFYVEVFTQYVEPGWITQDIYDDYHHLETKVEFTHDLNVNILNTYTITYIATDTNGNVSEPVYRNITVRDTVPPVVTLYGDPEFTIERGSKYPEYYAIAHDNYDGPITVDDDDITGAPDGMILGEFDVKYCVKDSSGNEGCATRLVKVDDTIPPKVLGVEDGKYYRTPLYIYYYPLTGTNEILTGKLNGKLITSDWYVKNEGSYHLEVSDDAGNVTEIDFVIDMTPPTLYGANDGEYINHAVKIYSDEPLKSITYRKDNGGYITIEEDYIDFTEEGQYWVRAVDMAGNTSGTISFVIDTTPPAYVLDGVLNEGITDTDVHLLTENDVIVSVNNEYIPTKYTFTENGYYQITIRDKAGNDVFLQFTINKKEIVTIGKEAVRIISQNNAIGTFVAKADNTYPKSSGFIYAKPLLDGSFEYIKGVLFSDEEYSKLTSGENVSFVVPNVDEDEMVVAFIVTLDELNKFTTQTVEGDDDSAYAYMIIAIVFGALVAGGFYFFVISKRKHEEEEEIEVVEEDDFF